MNFILAGLAASWMVVAYILYFILSSLIRSRRIMKLSKLWNCEDPPAWKTKYPFGIDYLLRARDADKKKLFPAELIQRTHDIGANTYSVTIFGVKMYFTADQENIKAMLALQFKDFDLGPQRRGNFWPLLGSGIFTLDGTGWERSRAMLRPQFARDQISNLELEECHVQNMMRALDRHLSESNKRSIEDVDLQELFFRLTLDSATEFLFGKSVDSQITLLEGEQNHYEKQDHQNSTLAGAFAHAFDEAQKVLSLRARLGDNYWLISPKGFKEHCQTCHKFIDHFVHLALNGELSEKSTGSGEKYVFLNALVAETRDPIELRSQLLNVLLAGRDTTASLLSWLFYLISKDSTRYKKLRDCIIDQFGTYLEPTNITFSSIKTCQYLQHCINEALRLYPVVPLNARIANKDTTLPRGGGRDGKSKIFIAKGTIVDYSVFAMHHRKDIWGEDADEFIPERWQGKKVGWEYLPVNNFTEF